MLEGTGIKEVLDGCEISVVAPGNAVVNVRVLTRSRYIMEVSGLISLHQYIQLLNLLTMYARTAE